MFYKQQIVHPAGIEPATTASKADMISVSPRVRKEFTYNTLQLDFSKLELF